MRVVIQRVLNASVQVNQQEVGAIDEGLVLLVGVDSADTLEDVSYVARKVAQMRIFEDCQGKMNRSLEDIKGAVLSISQFTLHAQTKKGNRPNFMRAGDSEHAKYLYESLNSALRDQHLNVETGQFGADMLVKIANDGPVTIWLDSQQKDY